MTLAIIDGGTGATNAADARNNLGTDLAANVNYVPAGTGAVDRSLQDKLSDVVNLADYGFVGDGTTDDTAAWQDGIAAAVAANVRKILVPWGATGVSLVTGQIVNGPLTSGLTFEGEGNGGANDTITGARLKYTGSGTCWFINHDTYNGEEGRWIWRNLAFEATDPEATMFDFNDTVNHGTPVDGEGYSYLGQVRFESCYFRGAGGAGEQVGDAIRGAKMFHLVIDESCYFTGWRRAVWLHGCDNCTLKMRAYLNARNVMLVGAGSFGNDSLVESRFFGPPYGEASEDAYLIWDSANSTTYLGCYLEDAGNPATATALLYIAGMTTTFVAPHLGLVEGVTCPLFHLDGGAREILVLHPKLTVVSTSWAPVIDPPASTGLGYPYGGNYMMIVGANVNFQRSVGTNPRLRWIGAQRGRQTPVDEGRAMLSDGDGYRPRQSILSALNFWDGPYGTAASDGVAEFVEDSASSQGWAMRCSYTDPNGGFYPEFLIGRDFMPGDLVKIGLRAKSTNGANWAFVAAKNGVYHSTVASLSGLGGSYGFVEGTVDLSSFAVGDVFGVLIYKAGASADIVVDYLAVDAVSPTVADPAGGGTVDTQARTAIASILDLLQTHKLMA